MSPTEHNTFRAIMVTDLVDFTAMLSALGDTHALALLNLHDDLLRRCVRQHRGIEHAHTGDGMITSFSTVAAALSCAQAVQHSLGQLDARVHEQRLRARIGIHCGCPRPRGEGIFGLCVVEAVRVCATAHGGQVVASHNALQALAGPLLGTTFDSLGTRQLKGIATPLRLFEVAWPAAAEHNQRRAAA
jgi:class 3 adenylate cyclase